jgi:RNA polymerase sigma-70 factor, ECF subfamily
MTTSNLLLVQRAREHDTEAFGALVERYRDMAYGLAYHLTGDFEAAADLAQEAFVQGFLKLEQLRDPARFSAWLRRILVNVHRMQIRHKEVAVVPLEEDMQLSTSQVSEMESVVREALVRLREPERLALTLHYINGYSQAEIGDFLGVPAATVRARVMRARQHLKEEMMTMVEDTFAGHKLSSEFTKNVLQRVNLSPIEPDSISLSFNDQVRAIIMGIGGYGDKEKLIALAMQPEDSYPIEDILMKSDHPQPKTRALQTTTRIMEAFDIKLRQVVLYLDPQGSCRARADFVHGRTERTIELRASDAIALAAQTGAEILAETPVIEKAKVGEEGLEPEARESMDALLKESMEALRLELIGCGENNKLYEIVRKPPFDPAAGKNVVRYRRNEQAGFLEFEILNSDQPPMRLPLAEYSHSAKALWEGGRRGTTSVAYLRSEGAPHDEYVEYAVHMRMVGEEVEECYELVGATKLPRKNRAG